MFGYKAQAAFFKHANIATAEAQIVQVDQVLKFEKPIVRRQAGTLVTSGDSVREAHGNPDHRDFMNIVTNEEASDP